MTLEQLIHQYITYRKSLGEKFKTNETNLKNFCRYVGPGTSIGSVTEDIINDFLYGDSETITSGWFVMHTSLLGFFRYAINRNYIITIPLPSDLPKRPEPFTPYIYSKEELKTIFDLALTYQTNKSFVEPYMIRSILILTYALGLRIHETLSIKLEDIDLDNRVIIIKKSKFYKARLVPVSMQLAQIVSEYLCWRKSKNYLQYETSYCFIGKNNNPFNIGTMRGIFQRLRAKANIKRTDNSTFQPRIHDLRHTFAVHRLTTWYKENKDVQQLLPILSTYLGHTNLAHTSVYLSMTNALLNEANIKFEKYAIGERL